MQGEKRECRYCGRSEARVFECHNTRDMEDGDKVCFAALIANGGGEYSANRRIAHEIGTRAALNAGERDAG